MPTSTRQLHWTLTFSNFQVNVRTLIQPSPLIVHRIYDNLVKLSSMKGTGVQKTKGDVRHMGNLP